MEPVCVRMAGKTKARAPPAPAGTFARRWLVLRCAALPMHPRISCLSDLASIVKDPSSIGNSTARALTLKGFSAPAMQDPSLFRLTLVDAANLLGEKCSCILYSLLLMHPRDH